MRHTLLGMLLLLLALGSASATSMCTTGPIELDPVTKILCGGLTFSDFYVKSAWPGTEPEVAYVTGEAANDYVSINFNPQLSGRSGPQDLWFYFTVSGSPVNWVQLTVGGVKGTIEELVCNTSIPKTGPNANTCPETTLANLVAFSPPSESQDQGSFTPVSKLYVFKDIGVERGGALSSFGQMYRASAPEPIPAALIGTGLVALGWLRRRAKRR